MKTDPLNILGLAMRKRGVTLGSKRVIEEIRNNKTIMVFLANDAGDNTAKKIRDKCDYYNIYLDETYDSTTLSKAIGKKGTYVIALTDKHLINALI